MYNKLEVSLLSLAHIVTIKEGLTRERTEKDAEKNIIEEKETQRRGSFSITPPSEQEMSNWLLKLQATSTLFTKETFALSKSSTTKGRRQKRTEEEDEKMLSGW